MALRAITISGTALAGLAVALAMVALGLALDWRGSVLAVASLGLMTGLAAAYPRNRKPWERRVAASIELCTAYGWMATLSMVASYCIASTTTGYADQGLAAMDRAIGFDWPAFYQWYTAQPLLRGLGNWAYGAIFFCPVALGFALGLTGRTQRAWTFLAANGLALLVTLCFFVFLPAQSALIHHMGAGGGYLPATGVQHAATIEALRSGTMHAIALDRLLGMVTFPSFHAVSAVLFIWAAWPVAKLKWIVLAINLAMLGATPIEGTHYVVDVIAGLSLAILSIATVQWLGGYATRKWPSSSIRWSTPSAIAK